MQSENSLKSISGFSNLEWRRRRIPLISFTKLPSQSIDCLQMIDLRKLPRSAKNLNRNCWMIGILKHIIKRQHSCTWRAFNTHLSNLWWNCRKPMKTNRKPKAVHRNLITTDWTKPLQRPAGCHPTYIAYLPTYLLTRNIVAISGSKKDFARCKAPVWLADWLPN